MKLEPQPYKGKRHKLRHPKEASFRSTSGGYLSNINPESVTARSFSFPLSSSSYGLTVKEEEKTRKERAVTSRLDSEIVCHLLEYES